MYNQNSFINWLFIQKIKYYEINNNTTVEYLGVGWEVWVNEIVNHIIHKKNKITKTNNYKIRCVHLHEYLII